MRKMIYSTETKQELLSTGYCFGLLYFILNLGVHPAAYIKLPNNIKIDKNEIAVHGGITYSENYLYINRNEKLDGRFIGWDYAHYGDYGGYEELLPLELRSGGKKWTTEEIYQEVRHACYQILKTGGRKLKERGKTNGYI